MARKNIAIQIGPSSATCLVILLAILKTQNYINISWLWVFAPYWIGLAILGIALLVSFFFIVLAAALK